MNAVGAIALDSWARINEPDCPILIEDRSVPPIYDILVPLLERAPFADRADGAERELAQQLAHLPPELRADILQLAGRFMRLMQVDAVRIRLEGVVSNACKKVHADYTDIRLITTYAGPGTDYAPHGDADCCLERVPTGAVALFKGRLFSPDHAPCLHRSPLIEGTGDKRLVLVIDTPLKAIPDMATGPRI